MFHVLDRKIRQMHTALAGLKTDDLSLVRPELAQVDGAFYLHVDFNAGTDESALANVASVLVANIACMKDHLKVWCKNNGRSRVFEGDNLINSNHAVALIHDLWNVDKHAELTSAPRSGHRPRLTDIRRVLSVSTGTEAGSAAFFSMDRRTGKITSGSTGSGAIELVLGATILDEHGNHLGEFGDICQQATQAWGIALSNAGVPLP